MMTKRLLIGLVCWVCLCGTTTILAAQTPAVPSDKLGWDVEQDPAGMTFSLTVDDGTRQPLSGATCGAMNAGISTCQAALPAMTAGTHRLRVIATMTVGGTTVDSAPSAELAISFIAIVTPKNVRLIKG